MIRPSRPGDEAALKHLWQIAFGDSPDVINHFFARLYQPGKAILWAEGESIASAIYLLDAGSTAPAGGKTLSTAYAYALGTLPEYRGRGLGSQVTKAAITHSFTMGFDCNVICPAEESLFPYYTRLGYTHFIPISEGREKRLKNQSTIFMNQVMSTSFSAYFQLRHSLIPPSSTTYPLNFLRYVGEAGEITGGGFYQFGPGGQLGCAATEWRGEELFIREILPASIAGQGVQALMEHLNAPSAIYRTISTSEIPPTAAHRPFALMAFAEEQHQATDDWYFPFVLD